MVDIDKLFKAVNSDDVRLLECAIGDGRESELRHFKINGLTVAHLAILNNRPKVLDYVLKACFSTELEDDDGDTLLFHAVGADNSTANDCVDVLLRHNANVNHHNRRGSTPIMIAAYMCNLYAIGCLLDFGAKVNEHDTLGESPISYAVKNYNRRTGRATMPQKDIIVELLKAGSSIEDLYRSNCVLGIMDSYGRPELIPRWQYSPSLLYRSDLCLVLINPNNQNLINQLL